LLMVGGAILRVEDAFEATESHEGFIASRPNQRDLVAHYARRIELSSPKNPTHASWPQQADLILQDEWASVELVPFGRPMPAAIRDVAGDAIEPIGFVAPLQAGNMSLSHRGREFLGRYLQTLNTYRLATVQRWQRIELPGSLGRHRLRLSRTSVLLKTKATKRN
jgi:hypothetical protein